MEAKQGGAGEWRELQMLDRTRIAYRVFEGDAPTVVILHGLAGSSTEFTATAEVLAPRRVILVDLRGHGRSTRVPERLDRAAFVDDVARVIRAEADAPVDLVGQSMGGHTAMLVAAEHPQLVRRVVLLEVDEGGGSRADHEAMADYFRSWPVPFADRDAAAAWLGDGPLETAWVADLEQRGDGLYPRFDPDVMLEVISHVAEPRWVEWESVTAPTFVVYADRGMFAEEQKSRFVARGGNVTRVDLSDASHDAHLDAFPQWIASLATFIAG